MSKKILLEQFEECNIEDISYCSICYAYTVYINGENYSVHEGNFFKYFSSIDEEVFKKSIKKVLLNTSYCCNWCVNHWGLDICACGSGEPFETCEGEYDICGKPMQEIDNYTHVRGNRSWI